MPSRMNRSRCRERDARKADSPATARRGRIMGCTGGRPDRGRPEGMAKVTGDQMTREVKLARTMVELADTLVADFDVIELLTLLADRCVDVLDVDAAGLMLTSADGELRSMASSSAAMHLLELFELQSQEGPCLDCYRTGRPVVNQDLATVNGRWPRFSVEALGAGFHSVHALPMRLRGSVIGALNLFHSKAGEMRPADIEAAQAFADVATIGVLQHRAALEAQVLTEQLTRPSTPASSSSKPREWWPNAKDWTWRTPLPGFETMLVSTIVGSPISPSRSLMEPCRPPRSLLCRGTCRHRGPRKHRHSCVASDQTSTTRWVGVSAHDDW